MNSKESPPVSDLVERLRTDSKGTGSFIAIVPLHALRHEAADRLTALEAENARLRSALEPFASDYAKRSRLAPGPDIDHWPIGDSSLTYGHLRSAYELIHPQIEVDEQ